MARPDEAAKHISVSIESVAVYFVLTKFLKGYHRQHNEEALNSQDYLKLSSVWSSRRP